MTKLINKYSDVFTTIIIVKDFDKRMYNSTFPKSLKISEVISAYKKDEPNDKKLPIHKFTFKSVQNL